MEILWKMVFWLIPIWVFLFIPFTTFYYEADDGMLMAGTAYAPNPIKRSRVGQACCYELFVLFFVFIAFLVTYLVLSDTKIPVFILGNERVPVAAQKASTCEQFAMGMVRFLFTKTDKKVIRGRVPEGKHCAGWLRDNELMHNNVSTVRDVNGLHSA